MDKGVERRTEQRLRYNWPIWFAEDFNGMLSQGQMADVSSAAAAFTCYNHEHQPYIGQYITARFSVPKYRDEHSFNMNNFIRSGHVCRIDGINNHINKIAIKFTEPLTFKPGEQRHRQEDLELPELHESVAI
jgi:hypothetical protein